MDEEILKAFEEIRAKLEERGITEKRLLGIIENPKKAQELDNLKQIRLFFDWYIKEQPLSAILQKDNFIKNIEKITYDDFKEFERNEANLSIDIICDDELKGIYNNGKRFLEINNDVFALELNTISSDITDINETVACFEVSSHEESSDESEQPNKKNGGRKKRNKAKDVENICKNTLTILADSVAAATATPAGLVIAALSVISGANGLYRIYKPHED